MTLDGIVFDNFLFPLFVAMVGFVSPKASICPNIFDDVVMHELVKGDVF